MLNALVSSSPCRPQTEPGSRSDAAFAATRVTRSLKHSRASVLGVPDLLAQVLSVRP